MSINEEDRGFLESLVKSKVESNEEAAAMEITATLSDEYVVTIDPKSPLDFYSGTTLGQWVTEMSRGQYGKDEFRSESELEAYVDMLPTSDVEIVDFLVHVSMGRLHVAVQGSGSMLWLVWNGRIYDERNEGFTDTVTNTLRKVLSTIADDVKGRAGTLILAADKNDRTRLIKLSNRASDYVSHLKTATGLNAVKRIMTGNEYLRFEEDEHENDARGYVVEADGRLRHKDNLDIVVEPNPTLLIRKTIGVNSTDEWENKGMWSQFLLETFGDIDEESGEFVRNEAKELLLSEMAGVAMIGTGQSKHMANIVGSSNSGKSLYIDGLKQVFGEYQSKMSNAGLIKMMGTNFYQDEARGQRLLWISEPDRKNVDEPFLKALTGGPYETLTTSRKGKSSVSWSPQCFFHVASNEPLQFDASDDALNKRMLTISAENSVEEDDPRFDPDRMEKIVAEDVESIYRWVLAGAKSFLDNGGKLHIPQEVRDIQATRSKAANSAVKWLHYMIDEGYMELDPTVKSMSKMHKWRDSDYDNYVRWEAQQGIRDALSNSEVKSAIEKYTSRPIGKDTDKKQSGAPRLWGVVEGENKGPGF